MPTPAVNGADSISQRTGGLRRPPSTDPRRTAPTSAPMLAPRAGVNPMSRMNRKAMRKVTPSRHGPDHVRDPESGELGDDAAEDGAGQHRGAGDDLGPREDPLQGPRVARRLERVDQPRLGRAGEEREPESEQDRRDRPADEPGADLPHHEVQERRQHQGGGAEQEREPAATRVGDDAGRDLEQDLADGEEGVDGERLGVVQPGVQQEQGVDAPDERCRERREQGEGEIRPLDGDVALGHSSQSMPGSSAGRG